MRLLARCHKVSQGITITHPVAAPPEALGRQRRFLPIQQQTHLKAGQTQFQQMRRDLRFRMSLLPHPDNQTTKAVARQLPVAVIQPFAQGGKLLLLLSKSRVCRLQFLAQAF